MQCQPDLRRYTGGGAQRGDGIERRLGGQERAFASVASAREREDRQNSVADELEDLAAVALDRLEASRGGSLQP